MLLGGWWVRAWRELVNNAAKDSELISITCTSQGGEERATVAVDGTLPVARVRQRLAKALRVPPWLFRLSAFEALCTPSPFHVFHNFL